MFNTKNEKKEQQSNYPTNVFGYLKNYFSNNVYKIVGNLFFLF